MAANQKGDWEVRLVVTIVGYGHAPALNVPEQFELVQRFLEGL